MSDDSSTRRRRFRFGLRMLFIAMTLAALALWGYWYGWPRWLAYRQQMQFEAAATQFKRGVLLSKTPRLAVDWYTRPAISENHEWDENGRFTRYMTYRWPHSFYVVYLQYENSRCSSVEVFRLPAPARNYAPQTARSQSVLAQQNELARTAPPLPGQALPIRPVAEPLPGLAYKIDFVEMISGDRRDALGFQFELIHADPPPDDAH